MHVGEQLATTGADVDDVGEAVLAGQPRHRAARTAPSGPWVAVVKCAGAGAPR